MAKGTEEAAAGIKPGSGGAAPKDGVVLTELAEGPALNPISGRDEFSPMVLAERAVVTPAAVVVVGEIAAAAAAATAAASDEKPIGGRPGAAATVVSALVGVATLLPAGVVDKLQR